MNDVDLYNEVAKIAHELYEKSGRVESRDLDNWFEAERIVSKRYATKEKNKGEVVGFCRKIVRRISAKKSFITSKKRKK